MGRLDRARDNLPETMSGSESGGVTSLPRTIILLSTISKNSCMQLDVVLSNHVLCIDSFVSQEYADWSKKLFDKLTQIFYQLDICIAKLEWCQEEFLGHWTLPKAVEAKLCQMAALMNLKNRIMHYPPRTKPDCLKVWIRGGRWRSRTSCLSSGSNWLHQVECAQISQHHTIVSPKL
jgi:hypothetical protein